MNTNHPVTGATAAILLWAALAAAAGTAQAQGQDQSQSQVNRCVDADGRVTLTDDSCPHNSRVVNHDVSDGGEVGLVVTSGPQATHLAQGPSASDAGSSANPANPASWSDPAAIATGLTRSRWADLPRPLVRKAAGTDAITLQTARTTLQMRDEARRQSRMLATR